MKVNIPYEDIIQIENYVDRVIYTKELEMVVKNYKTQFNILYRGIKCRRNLIEFGSYYKHFANLSSWSKDINVAIDFARTSDIHDDILIDSGNDESLFINVVFVWNNAEGLDISKSLLDEELFENYEHENEVLTDCNDFFIKDIISKEDYMLVYLSV